MNKNNYYRGIRGVYMIWHGEWSDPEISYKGMVVNYFAVEDTIWEEYKEAQAVKNPEDDNAFTKYCQKHAAEIKQLITDIWNSQKN